MSSSTSSEAGESDSDAGEHARRPLTGRSSKSAADAAAAAASFTPRPLKDMVTDCVSRWSAEFRRIAEHPAATSDDMMLWSSMLAAGYGVEKSSSAAAQWAKKAKAKIRSEQKEHVAAAFKAGDVSRDFLVAFNGKQKLDRDATEAGSGASGEGGRRG